MKRLTILVCSLVIGGIIGYWASFSFRATDGMDATGRRSLSRSVSSDPVSILSNAGAREIEERVLRSWLEGRHTVRSREELDKLVVTVAKQKGKEIFAMLEAIPHFELRTDLQAIALVKLVESEQLSLREFCEGSHGYLFSLSLKRRLKVVEPAIRALASTSLDETFQELEPLADQPYAESLYRNLVEGAPSERSPEMFELLKTSEGMTPIRRASQMGTVLIKWAEEGDLEAAWKAATEEMERSSQQESVIGRITDFLILKKGVEAKPMIEALPEGKAKEWGLESIPKYIEYLKTKSGE